MHRGFCLATLTGLILLPTVLMAESPDAADAVDGDFPYQGEFVGTVGDQSVGLQAYALGKGEFGVTLYAGGLPGAGGDKTSRTTGHGIRSDGSVTGTLTIPVSKDLESSAAEFTLTETAVRVSDSEGGVLGTLKKTHRKSVTLGVAPPWGATTLFDGHSAYHFKGGRITDAGLLMEGTELKTAYVNFMLHVEFKLPYMPTARGQGRGNSGVYLESRYEVQILDSFGLEGAFNECGALYRQKAPDINMCFPPLVWQTYDIDFRAAKFDRQGKKVKDAILTVWHNGVKIHDNVHIKNKTGAGKQEGPEALVTKFQDHHNPVRFRNIWIIDYMRPLPDAMAHPDLVEWTPELYKNGRYLGIMQPEPVSGPHVNIHGFIR